MPTFVHSPLLWGLLIVGIPILIHLINLLRHRRVRWAAMDFLLVSQKRNRKWILLKQLLLLLMRMAAIAAVVLMFAQPVVRSHWGKLFGQGEAHHVILLDDSYSMSDQWAQQTAFDRAKDAIGQLTSRLARNNAPQFFTLIRFSEAAKLASGTQPELYKEQMDLDFSSRLEQFLASAQPTELSISPASALQAIQGLWDDPSDETRLVYLFSDFREIDWNQPNQIKSSLQQIEDSGGRVHLVRCADTLRENLTIEDLAVIPGTRAAGVPVNIELSVHNYGQFPAREVTVALEEDGQPRSAVVFEQIKPGETTARRFSVNFPTAGSHSIEAILPQDSVAADNARYLVLDLPQQIPVLVVESNPTHRDSHYLTLALAPGGPIHTGISPRVEPPRFLRTADLNTFGSIYLVNVPRLDPLEVQMLEDYVRNGGSVAIFVGTDTQARTYNEQLYRDGNGLFPAPLLNVQELLVDRLNPAPDLEISDHPLFHIFAGERNSFLDTVSFERYFATVPRWAPTPDGPVRVIANLRNGAPLVLERTLGKGHCVAFLSTLSPEWNNWARGNPSFVVAMLELQSYLASSRYQETPRTVGTPLLVPVDIRTQQPQVRIIQPGADQSGGVVVNAESSSAKSGSDKSSVAESGRVESGNADPDNVVVRTDQSRAVYEDTLRSGVYLVQWTANDGRFENKQYAYNVSPVEGDLHLLDYARIAARLGNVGYELHDVNDFQYAADDLAGFNLSESLLYFLVLLLLGEQFLAYLVSYHTKAVSRKGGSK